MGEIDIPASESDKIYPFVPASLIPAIILTVTIFGILITDIATGTTTNVFVFYIVTSIFPLMLLTKETVPIMINILGFSMPTLRSKIVGILSIPVGIFGGWLLVKFSTTYSSILPIATFPFAIRDFATAGLSFLSSLTPGASLFFFLGVAFFEETMALYIAKTIANWFNKKFNARNTIFIILISLLLSRMILVTHHWVAYGGWSQPYLYLSALMLFLMFTVSGIFTGLIAKGKFGELSDLKVIPILAPIMIAIHFGFDIFLTRLMIIP